MTTPLQERIRAALEPLPQVQGRSWPWQTRERALDMQALIRELAAQPAEKASAQLEAAIVWAERDIAHMIEHDIDGRQHLHILIRDIKTLLQANKILRTELAAAKASAVPRDITIAVRALKNIEHATAPGDDDAYHESAYTLARKALSDIKWGTVDGAAPQPEAQTEPQRYIMGGMPDEDYLRAATARADARRIAVPPPYDDNAAIVAAQEHGQQGSAMPSTAAGAYADTRPGPSAATDEALSTDEFRTLCAAAGPDDGSPSVSLSRSQIRRVLSRLAEPAATDKVLAQTIKYQAEDLAAARAEIKSQQEFIAAVLLTVGPITLSRDALANAPFATITKTPQADLSGPRFSAALAAKDDAARAKGTK